MAAMPVAVVPHMFDVRILAAYRFEFSGHTVHGRSLSR
jgi:hypothetical protein